MSDRTTRIRRAVCASATAIAFLGLLALPAQAQVRQRFTVHAGVAGVAAEGEGAFEVGLALPPPGGPMLGDGPGMMLPLLLFAGDLTDEQRDKVHEIMRTSRQSIGGLFSQLRAANDELAGKILSSGEVTKADLQPTLDRIASIRQQLLDNGVKVALEVRALMTPDQISKAASVRSRLEELEEEKRNLIGRDVLFFKN